MTELDTDMSDEDHPRADSGSPFAIIAEKSLLGFGASYLIFLSIADPSLSS